MNFLIFVNLSRAGTLAGLHTEQDVPNHSRVGQRRLAAQHRFLPEQRSPVSANRSIAQQMQMAWLRTYRVSCGYGQHTQRRTPV
jgi:hypothetical protein